MRALAAHVSLLEGLREGIADAQAEAIAMVDLLRNLVAVIDRDGGQRQDGEHISVTAARATETVVGMIQQLDNTAATAAEIVPRLTKERDEARGAADKLGADAYRLCYVISLIRQWANTYGADLVPPGVDTYGEGKRDAKRAVRNILNAAPPAEIVPPSYGDEGAAQERAAIVAWLKGEVARNTEATYFEPKWSPATGHCVADLARCIERGEHEKGAK